MYVPCPQDWFFQDYSQQKNLDSIFPEVHGEIVRKYGSDPLTETNKTLKPKKKIITEKILNDWIKVEIIEKSRQKPRKKVTISDFKHCLKIKNVFKNESPMWQVFNPPVKKPIKSYPKYLESQKATKHVTEEIMPVITFSGFSTYFITEHVASVTYKSTANEE